MTTYAIGDLQGCARAFDELLDAISFDAAHDHLWLAGDLVNRGPRSLEVLRRVVSLQNNLTAVLGNHDLHLLAAAAGVREPTAQDTFQPILDAPDAAELVDWLRRQPLLHYDEARDRVLVHAGLPPTWSLREARTHAEEVSQLLARDSWTEGLSTMYGDDPHAWSPTLDPVERRRYTINALTRIRFCDASGGLDFDDKGPPGSQAPSLKPWYEFPRRGGYTAHVIFGHWASLGLLRGSDFTCIDSGCVWGRSLTALPLDPPGEPISIHCTEGHPKDTT